ncbi:MAG TPA: hypothetical protein V6D48_06225 [Oculatellaceae cyanobacterium]
MVREKITALLESCAGKSAKFPPTLLYNEGWLLRLVLDWFSSHSVPNHVLAFSENAGWFSEALLPSPFLPRHKGDPLAETWTHADGVIGHFRIGDKRKADISLLPDATQFVVLEAKLMSGLSVGVKHALNFDQAARSVACIAEVLYRANRPAPSMKQLGFYVLAPKGQIEQDIFGEQMSLEAISEKVAQRVHEYDGTKDDWHSIWFQSVRPSIELSLISWEEIIDTVRKSDMTAADGLEEFYQKALKFNAR